VNSFLNMDFYPSTPPPSPPSPPRRTPLAGREGQTSPTYESPSKVLSHAAAARDAAEAAFRAAEAAGAETAACAALLCAQLCRKCEEAAHGARRELLAAARALELARASACEDADANSAARVVVQELQQALESSRESERASAALAAGLGDALAARRQHTDQLIAEQAVIAQALGGSVAEAEEAADEAAEAAYAAELARRAAAAAAVAAAALAAQQAGGGRVVRGVQTMIAGPNAPRNGSETPPVRPRSRGGGPTSVSSVCSLPGTSRLVGVDKGRTLFASPDKGGRGSDGAASSREESPPCGRTLAAAPPARSPPVARGSTRPGGPAQRSLSAARAPRTAPLAGSSREKPTPCTSLRPRPATAGEAGQGTRPGQVARGDVQVPGRAGARSGSAAQGAAGVCAGVAGRQHKEEKKVVVLVRRSEGGGAFSRLVPVSVAAANASHTARPQQPRW